MNSSSNFQDFPDVPDELHDYAKVNSTKRGKFPKIDLTIPGENPTGDERISSKIEKFDRDYFAHRFEILN